MHANTKLYKQMPYLSLYVLGEFDEFEYPLVAFYNQNNFASALNHLISSFKHCLKHIDNTANIVNVSNGSGVIIVSDNLKYKENNSWDYEPEVLGSFQYVNLEGTEHMIKRSSTNLGFTYDGLERYEDLNPNHCNEDLLDLLAKKVFGLSLEDPSFKGGRRRRR